MFLHRYVKGSLVGKFSIGGVLGLLLFVATFVMNVPGASAHAHYSGAYSYAPTQAPAQQRSIDPPVAPQSVAAGDGSVASMIYQVFGSYGAAAVNVATCESGLNPGAYNSSGASGVFQIMPGTWAGTSEAGQSPFNAYANILAAHEIFVRDGYSWREWTCKG